MCGICGVVAGSGAADADAVGRAADAIRHREPDHGATASLGRCALGYRRLRVIDLVTGDQPVTNEDGSVSAVFNGEIYGFRALRDELRPQGTTFAAPATRRVIPHLYEEYGERFVERLDGMFASRCGTRAASASCLARDRLGKKPLLWTPIARRRHRVRVRAQGAGDVAGRRRAPFTSPHSMPTSRSATSPGRRPQSSAFGRSARLPARRGGRRDADRGATGNRARWR